MDEVRLIVDSSVNQNSNPAHNLYIVPLTISFGGQDFRDDENLNIPDFLEKMEANQESGKTTCPSIQEWLDALENSKNAIIVTMTSGLSGTYASALQARDIYLENNPDSKVIVVDTRSAGPEMAILLQEIEKLLNSDIRWVDLEEKIAEAKTQTHLLFILQSLHNLSLNGRVSPAVAKLAGMLHIDIVGTASKEGKLEPLGKARGMKRAMREIIKQIKERKYQGGNMIIDYCENKDEAETLKEKILAEFPDSQIELRPKHGLCSFYAEKGGLMVGFHE